MTTAQFISRQNRIVESIIKDNKPLLFAVKSTMALQAKRIFLDGKNAEGTDIGTYSSNPIYVNPKNSPKKFTPKGKEGKSKFKNGNSHKTAYFNDYLSFKKYIGRNKNKSTVDLILTGELSKDWANAEAISKANATRLNAHHYVVGIKQSNADKVARYGNVFGLTSSERRGFIKTIQFELGKELRFENRN